MPDYRIPEGNYEIPAHYLTCPLDKLLKVQTTSYGTYFYQCFSLSDIIVSILHFLAMNDYKINRCRHCGRYFATLSLKQEYCPRNSTYPDREHYSCYEAVKRIRQDLRRIYIRMYKNLHANYIYEHRYNFENEFAKAFDDVKAHSDYETIDKCYEILSPEYWYTKKCNSKC